MLLEEGEEEEQSVQLQQAATICNNLQQAAAEGGSLVCCEEGTGREDTLRRPKLPPRGADLRGGGAGGPELEEAFSSKKK